MGIYIVPNPKHFLALSGGTVSGGTYFSNSLSANTYFSGSTPLEQIIYNISSQYSGGSGSVDIFIQPGLNTYTGGTASLPTVNVSSLTVDYIVVTGSSLFESVQINNLSGSGIMMVVTDNDGNLSVQSIPSAGQSTVVRNGLNTYTAGTFADYTVNVSGLTIDNIIVTGNSTFNSLSASTFYSGGTELTGVIQNIIDDYGFGTGSTNVFLQDGINTFTGGTTSNPTVNVTGLTIDNINVTGISQFNIITAQTISADTIYVNGGSFGDAITSIQNLGTGATIYSGTSANTAYFRSLRGKSGITLTETSEYIEIFFTGETIYTDVFSGNVTYIGYTFTNDTQTKIMKITSGLPNSTSYIVEYANGNQNYDKIWSDRYLYTYF